MKFPWDLVIQGGGSLVDTLQGRNAINNAEQELDEGAEIAGITLQEYINRFAPWLLDAAKMGGEWVRDAGEFAAGDVTAAADRGAARMDQSNDLYKQLYEDYRSQLSPYEEAGRAALEKAQSIGDEKFVFSQDDPSYQWRMEQGQKALERSRAARGGFNSGATLKSLANYSQGLASTEYAAAFDRFQKDRTNRFSMSKDLIGVGERANGLNLSAMNNYGDGVSRNNATAGQFDLSGRKYANDYRTSATKYASDANIAATGDFVRAQLEGGQYRAERRIDQANARAKGDIARANAWSNVIRTGSKLANDYFKRRENGGNAKDEI